LIDSDPAENNDDHDDEIELKLPVKTKRKSPKVSYEDNDDSDYDPEDDKKSEKVEKIEKSWKLSAKRQKSTTQKSGSLPIQGSPPNPVPARSSTANDFFSLRPTTFAKTNALKSAPKKSQSQSLDIDLNDDDDDDDDESSLSEEESKRRRYRKKQISEPRRPKPMSIEDEDEDLNLSSDEDFGPPKERTKKPSKKEDKPGKGKEKVEVVEIDDFDILPPAPVDSSSKAVKLLLEKLNAPKPKPQPVVSEIIDDMDDFKPDASLLSHSSNLMAPAPDPSEKDAAVIIQVVRKEDPRKKLPPPNSDLGRLARKPLKFKTFKSQNFEKIFSALKDINGAEGITREVILRYKGVKIFSRSTPQSLNIKDGETFEASTIELEQYLEKLEKEEEERRRRAQDAELDKIIHEADLKAGMDADLDNPNLIFLKIKFSNGEAEKIRVKKTSTIESIKNHFEKKKNAPGKIVLKLDGERIADDETIESLDLENDDMIDAEIRS